MKEDQRIRDSVRETYARSLSVPSACGCGGHTPKHVATRLTGYTWDQVKSLPPDAVANSFGCGNPLSFSEVREGDVVLDLGSGAGTDILLAAKKVGTSGRAIGVDMTDELLQRARENIAACGLANAEVRKGIIEDLPVESESVDWVISNCVINLSPEKHRVFREIARVLKPGGRLLVSDIVAEELPESVRHNTALHSSCIAGAISEREYLDGLSGVGLAELEVRERIIYEESQLREFMAPASFDGAESHCSYGGQHVAAKSVAELAESLAGKLWSALFYGVKPAG